MYGQYQNNQGFNGQSNYNQQSAYGAGFGGQGQQFGGQQQQQFGANGQFGGAAPGQFGAPAQQSFGQKGQDSFGQQQQSSYGQQQQSSYGQQQSSYGQQQSFGQKGQESAPAKPLIHNQAAMDMVATGMSAEAEAFRKEKHIRILSRADACPAPLQSFEELSKYNVPEYLYKNFLQGQMGFAAPSPIQSQTWPVALGGRDMIGIAETGSGKTLSFLLPGAVHITQNEQRLQRGETGPIVLCLAPTRELAQQIEVEAQKLSKATDGQVRTTCLVGGVPKGPQARDLR